MLVLSRQLNERVAIGDPKNPIGYVRVVAIRGDKVRLGFEFDKSVPVHREEIAQVIAAGEVRGEGS